MKKAVIIILILISVIAVVFVVFTCNQKQEMGKLEKYIEFLKSETIPVKFRIESRDDESLRVGIKFFDAAGNEFGKTETNLKGKELSFDFITIKVKDSYLSFPYKVFTDQIPAKEGIKLTSFYDKDGAPVVFVYDNMDNELLKNLKALFIDIKDENFENLKSYFGNLVHDIEKINSFKTGIVYKITAHVKGGIEVAEDF